MLNAREYVRICEIIAEERALKVTLVQSGKGALMAGGGAFLGSLLGGPLGLFIGGTVGAGYAALKSRNTYKPLVQVIAEMSPQKRQALATHLMGALSGFKVESAIQLVALMANDKTVEETIIQAIGSFLVKELGMMIAS